MKAYLFEGVSITQKECDAYASSSDAFAKIGEAYLHNIDLIYFGVNSIILYKLRYYSIYIFNYISRQGRSSGRLGLMCGSVGNVGQGLSGQPLLPIREHAGKLMRLIQNNFFIFVNLHDCCCISST